MLEQLYHAFDPNDWTFRHNVKVGHGRVVAASFARAIGELPLGAMSPYEAFMTERAKEEVFERIRAEDFPKCPTRLGSIFLFPDRETADVANEQWWANQRVLLPAHIITARRVGVFDSRKLDARQDAWIDAAREYWGEFYTQNPRLEIVVEGAIQLLGWEPYGHIGPPPSML